MKLHMDFRSVSEISDLKWRNDRRRALSLR